MQPATRRVCGEIDAQHHGATPRHRVSRDAAATAHIEDLLARECRQLVDPVEPQRVDLMKRFELAVRVPPAVGQFTEFREFLRIAR